MYCCGKRRQSVLVTVVTVRARSFELVKVLSSQPCSSHAWATYLAPLSQRMLQLDRSPESKSFARAALALHALSASCPCPCCLASSTTMWWKVKCTVPSRLLVEARPTKTGATGAASTSRVMRRRNRRASHLFSSRCTHVIERGTRSETSRTEGGRQGVA